MIGEGSLVEPDTVVGDAARLAHASSLHVGQCIPSRGHWHGFPARPAEHAAPTLPSAPCPRRRRAAAAVAELAVVVLGAPLLVAAVVAVGDRVPGSEKRCCPEAPARRPAVLPPGARGLGRSALGARARSRRGVHAAPPPGPHPGPRTDPPALRSRPRLQRHWPISPTCRSSSGCSGQLLIVGYLRGLGCRVAEAGRTGSNVGAELRHENPYAITVGPGTMLLRRRRPGEHRDVGVGFPDRAPQDRSWLLPGEHDLGAAGCPARRRRLHRHQDDDPGRRQIPGPVSVCSARRPSRLHERRGDEADFALSRPACAGGWHRRTPANLRTMALFLVAQWLRVACLWVLGLVTVNLEDTVGVSIVACAALAAGPLNLGYGVLLERLGTRFRALRRSTARSSTVLLAPERFWKLSIQPGLLNGTRSRARCGECSGCGSVDGSSTTGRASARSHSSTSATMSPSTPGDPPAHSMEDGVFEAAPITVDSGAELAPMAFVRCGTVIGRMLCSAAALSSPRDNGFLPGHGGSGTRRRRSPVRGSSRRPDGHVVDHRADGGFDAPTEPRGDRRRHVVAERPPPAPGKASGRRQSVVTGIVPGPFHGHGSGRPGSWPACWSVWWCSGR